MSLFNEYEAMTPTGQIIADQIAKAIKPILDDAENLGLKLREVQSIAASEIACLVAEKVLRAAIKKRREAKK